MTQEHSKVLKLSPRRNINEVALGTRYLILRDWVIGGGGGVFLFSFTPDVKEELTFLLHHLSSVREDRHCLLPYGTWGGGGGKGRPMLLFIHPSLLCCEARQAAWRQRTCTALDCDVGGGVNGELRPACCSSFAIHIDTHTRLGNIRICI